MTVSIGELQRNISIIKKLKEPLFVIDKRTNKQIARIEPIKDDDMDLLETILDFDKKVNESYTRENWEEVYTKYLEEKYDFN